MHIHNLIQRYPALAGCQSDIAAAAGMLIDCFAGGGKLLVCGNGGSAADAEHIVGELMKAFLLPRRLPDAEIQALQKLDEDGAWLAATLERGLPAVSLCAHSALMTAVANDRTAETIFAQQVTALGCPGDVLMTISTSGNSRNCVLAAKMAKLRDLRVIALTGAKESRLSAAADVCIRVPETETYKVQEMHLPVYHALCAQIEAHFFGE